MCYNSESTKAQRPAGSVCAHAGDCRPYLAQGSSMQSNRRSHTQCACETVVRRKRVVTNRVAYTLYAGLMPQRQAITMIIIYCSKPQQNDAVTPTPLAHRSHTCMCALALGHDKMMQPSCSHMFMCTLALRNTAEPFPPSFPLTSTCPTTILMRSQPLTMPPRTPSIPTLPFPCCQHFPTSPPQLPPLRLLSPRRQLWYTFGFVHIASLPPVHNHPPCTDCGPDPPPRQGDGASFFPLLYCAGLRTVF